MPAADEVWRLQGGSDPECRVFQALADKGHYGGKGGTRQGIYVCSPSGEFLGSINSLNPDAVMATLNAALEKWRQMPEAHRAASGEPMTAPTHRWETSYPEAGLVLVSTNRDVRAEHGHAQACGDRWNRDHLWFSAEEARAWLPDDPAPGSIHVVPPALVRRLARFHLVDNVRGQTLPFATAEVLAGSEIQTEVLERRSDLVRLRISGSTIVQAEGPWLMGDTIWNESRESPRSMTTKLLGHAEYDLGRSAFTQFEMVARGRRQGRTENNARRNGPDMGTIGFYFTLASAAPADRVPPAFIDLYNAEWVMRPPEAEAEAAPASPAARNSSAPLSAPFLAQGILYSGRWLRNSVEASEAA